MREENNKHLAEDGEAPPSLSELQTLLPWPMAFPRVSVPVRA